MSLSLFEELLFSPHDALLERAKTFALLYLAHFT
jgi:hypothetical protein